MTILQVAAKPSPFGFDVARTAVIVVDMLNDFGSPGGMFDLADINIAPIRKIVPNIAALLGLSRQAGLPIIYLKQQHTADLLDAGFPAAPHYLKHKFLRIGDTVPAPDGRESRILIEGTWSTDIVDDLRPEPHDILVGKHRYSGFFQTGLDRLLKAKNINALIFAGATTSICVEATVRDAMYLDYSCLVVADCTAEPIANDAPRSNHEASLLNIELLFGWIAELKDIAAAFDTQA